MKVLDEKGKLFGLINIIDLLVILWFWCSSQEGYGM